MDSPQFQKGTSDFAVLQQRIESLKTLRDNVIKEVALLYREKIFVLFWLSDSFIH